MMVNKLGDPDKKTASAAGHQLRNVLQQHPNMQIVIAREVQQLAHRPHLSPRALYNCIVFLNQLQFKRSEKNQDSGEQNTFDGQSATQSPSLPASLIKTYFGLFEVAVQQHSSQSSSKKRKSSSSDEAGTMKSRLLSALLTGVNRAHPYLPEKDQDMEEHVDALYRIVHTATPGACTQALMLLFHLAVGLHMEKDQGDDDHGLDNSATKLMSEESRRRQDRFYRALYATLSKNNLVSGGKHLTMYFNLLYKAMKYDTDTNRVHAFSKRLMAAVMHAPSPSIAACLYLLQEISKTHGSLRSAWEDIPDPESSASLVLDDSKREPKAGIVDLTQLGNGEKATKGSPEVTHGTPPCWEISLFAHHFHPSVAKFANDMGEIDYAGDPLQDFGLAPFLDKFAYRNPKSREKLFKQQQAGGTVATSNNRRMNKLRARLELPVNDPSFLEKTDINEQEEFFHRFFIERARLDEIKGISRKSNNEVERKPNNDSDNDDGWDAAEDEAFDAAEAAEVDGGGKSFEEYEAAWETDEEEEAFVDSLAMKLIEDAADGPVDIDDDPEGMEDWGDLDESENDQQEEESSGNEEEKKRDEEEGSTSSKSMSDEEPIEPNVANDSDDDAFMEAADSSEEGSSSDEDAYDEPVLGESEIVGGFDAQALGEEEDSEEEIEDGCMALLEDESVDDEEEDERPQKKGRQEKEKKSKRNSLPTFADADDYAEMIEKSFQELKRSASQLPYDDDGDDEEEDVEAVAKPDKPSKKKKRRRRTY